MSKHANTRARSSAAASKSSRRRRAARWARVALVAAPVLGAGAVASPALAHEAHKANGAPNYSFETLDNASDLTFNQLLGINNKGLIAGYFGSGQAGHPNQGYLLTAPYGQAQYHSENWPQSVQTQVTGLNDHGVTVGFWSTMNNAGAMPVNDNRAFVSFHGYFLDADFPTSMPASPPVDQLLGVNDNDIAVGFYTDANNNNHAYSYNIRRNSFTELTPNGISSPTAAGINNKGDIAGFGTDSQGAAVGYLLKRDGNVTILNVPGSSSTSALGVNDQDEVVGVYQVGTGSTAVMHGFTWSPRWGFSTVDDPNGMGTTTINGVNDKGQLVGFYTDAAGNVDGLLATPQHHS
jgi:hypothetical protein